MTPNRTAQWLALLVPLALIAGALTSQYGFGLFPCEMCMWQRWPHYTAIVLAALSFVVAPARTPLVWLATLAIAVSGAIGAFMPGSIWLVGRTDAVRHQLQRREGSALERIMNAPVIRCDVAPWDLFGVSLAGWNAIFSLGGALVIVTLMLKGKAK